MFLDMHYITQVAQLTVVCKTINGKSTSKSHSWKHTTVVYKQEEVKHELTGMGKNAS